MQCFCCMCCDFWSIRQWRYFSKIWLKSLFLWAVNNILNRQNTRCTFQAILKHSSKWNWLPRLKDIAWKTSQFSCLQMPPTYGCIHQSAHFSKDIVTCQNPHWNNPRHKLKPYHKPCGYFHHNRGNTFHSWYCGAWHDKVRQHGPEELEVI
jgi:hypothetical protein